MHRLRFVHVQETLKSVSGGVNTAGAALDDVLKLLVRAQQRREAWEGRKASVSRCCIGNTRRL